MPGVAADAEVQIDEARLRANASRNALNRLVRCLFAERLLDAEALLWAHDANQAWLPLWQQRLVLHFSDLRRAPAAGLIHDIDGAAIAQGSGRRAPEVAEMQHEALLP
ncbi:MAG: hypothetical protein ACK5CS_30145, partial [Bradyrhizobium sp.]